MAHLSTRARLVKVVLSLALLFPSSAFAGSFKVVPVKLHVAPGQKTIALTIANTGEDNATIQLDAMEWTQDQAGEDHYHPTKDLIFFPKILKLEKGEEKLLRLGFQGRSNGGKERTYRLYLQELPVSQPGETAIIMPLTLGIPIFVGPTKAVQARAIETVETVEEWAVVKIRNDGNSHFMVTDVHVAGLDASGMEAFTDRIDGWYVLAGATKAFPVKIPAEACGRTSVIKVTVKIGQEILKAESAVDHARCVRQARKPEGT